MKRIMRQMIRRYASYGVGGGGMFAVYYEQMIRQQCLPHGIEGGGTLAAHHEQIIRVVFGAACVIIVS